MKILKLIVLIIGAMLLAPTVASAQNEKPVEAKKVLSTTEVKEYDLPVIEDDSIVMMKIDVERELTRLTLKDQKLQSLLDSIISNQMKCGYDPAYCLWKLKLEKKNGNFFVILDLSYVMSKTFDYVGFLEIQGFKVLVKGEKNSKLYKEGKKELVRYNVELPSVAAITTPRWLYVNKDNVLKIVMTDSKECK